MISKYVAWETKEEPNAFALKSLKLFLDNWKIVRGLPVSEIFPQNVVFTVDPDFPYDTLLVDAFETTYSLTVISPRLKEFFEQRNVTKVEYLPVTILDHKNRPAAQYFILNSLDPVDLLDLKASEAESSIISEGTIGSVKRIVFDESKVDPDLQIFKLKGLYDHLIVRRDLAEAIGTENFTGIQWVELDKFKKKGP